jgi:ketosteroid isomerase-like protein
MYPRRIGERVSREVLDRFQIQERFDCWNQAELEPMLEMYAEDAVFDVSSVFVDVAPVHGHEDMLRYWRELRETWGWMRTDPLELLELEDGRFVLEILLSGRGTRSGVEADRRVAFLYTLRRDGKVIRAELYPDVAAALAAGEASTRQTA